LHFTGLRTWQHFSNDGTCTLSGRLAQSLRDSNARGKETKEMIDTALVLNCPSTMGAYQHRHIENIECWLDFFVNEERIHVVATPSSERWQDLAHLEYDKELYTLLPVLSFDTCSRWQAGLFEALALYQPRNHVFLWAADFFYSDEAKRAAEKMLDYSGNEDLVVGTIEAVGKKEDIDRCATHPFIEIWFPEEFETHPIKRLFKTTVRVVAVFGSVSQIFPAQALVPHGTDHPSNFPMSLEWRGF
jgi:hypothetical protein